MQNIVGDPEFQVNKQGSYWEQKKVNDNHLPTHRFDDQSIQLVFFFYHN